MCGESANVPSSVLGQLFNECWVVLLGKAIYQGRIDDRRFSSFHWRRVAVEEDILRWLWRLSQFMVKRNRFLGRADWIDTEIICKWVRWSTSDVTRSFLCFEDFLAFYPDDSPFIRSKDNIFSSRDRNNGSWSCSAHVGIVLQVEARDELPKVFRRQWLVIAPKQDSLLLVQQIHKGILRKITPVEMKR